MAFSFLEKIISVIPSLVIPGSVGTAISGGLAQAFGAPSASPITPAGGIIPASIAAGPMAALARLPPMAGALATGGLGILAEILARAKSNTGRRVTKREIIQAAKSCGIELTAQSMGISEIDVCRVIAAGAPRRRRGISAADMRRTRSTIRKVNTIRKDLKQLAR